MYELDFCDPDFHFQAKSVRPADVRILCYIETCFTENRSKAFARKHCVVKVSRIVLPAVSH